jgi:predicted ester cyclase
MGDFIHDDFIADYRPQGSLRQGLEDARKMVRGAHETFQDFHEEMHDVVAEGDRVVAHFTISGRQVGDWGALPPTGKLLRYEEMTIFHFKDGKIVYQRGLVDNLRALYQYGSDAPEKNPPSPRTNPEITRLQQHL